VSVNQHDWNLNSEQYKYDGFEKLT